ncbi:MAG: HesA/MoeB/ThiF family protein [Bacteroidales bacterium]|nr:HesA/MoeB/ThiF family protein [Bacteroidales bacterium]
MNRYIKNQNMLSEEENLRLREFSVAVAGCGGLGGYLIEMLARLGIGHITAIDGDVFDVSNLNRQLLSLPENIGKSKALAAKQRVAVVNPEITVTAIESFLTKENATELLSGHHVICDALDSISARLLVQKAAEELETPMVHAAIAGWYAQVCTIFPGERTLNSIYPIDFDKGEETDFGNPSFTPALAASIQVAEVLKVMLHKDHPLRNKLLTINLLDHEYTIIEL